MSFVLQAALDARDFDLEVSVADGETVAVLGPNGAGKSTLLGLIAGMLAPDRGRAVLDDVILFDLGGATSAGAGLGGATAVDAQADARASVRRRESFKPPHARSVSLLAQEPLLFPHLSVLDNVGFGPRSSGRSRRDSRSIALDWLDEVDAREFAARKPAQLSGGQAQRIAVARALAAEPALLLLDEPLSALDIEVAPAIRTMLRRVLAHRSALIVTHDVIDAYELADRVIVIDGGRVVENGPTKRVLEHPRSSFAQQLLATNVVAGSSPGASRSGTAAAAASASTTAAASHRARAVRRLSRGRA
uniref:sulfate/molybdate ABC transporter ATP-binding protein n=1 Tax=Subtercola endophyticus TaxID=2895559 RepID=UPI0036F23461